MEVSLETGSGLISASSRGSSEIIQDRLGHSTIDVTTDIRSHILSGMDDRDQ